MTWLSTLTNYFSKDPKYPAPPEYKNYKWYEKIHYFACALGLMYFTQVMASVYSRTILSHLENRYGVDAEFMGNVSSFYAAGCIICYVLIVFYQDKLKSNRTRYLMIFQLIAASGSFILPFAHFLAPEYDYTASYNRKDQSGATNESSQHEILSKQIQNMCIADNLNSTCDMKNAEEDAYALNDITKLFYVAEFLMGFGVSVIWPLGYTYLDDYCIPGRSTFWYSAIASFLMFGWSTSFFISSYFSTIWVDFPKAAPTDISVEDTNAWVGAWWLGYSLYVFLQAAVAWILYYFPKELPPQYMIANSNESIELTLNKDTVDKINRKNEELEIRQKKFDSMPFHKQLYRILTNGCLICIMGNEILDNYGHQVNFFLPKYMERMFGITLGKAINISAWKGPIMAVCSFIGGIFFTKIIQLNAQSGKKWVIGVSWIVLSTFVGYVLIQCPNRPTSGVDLVHIDESHPSWDDWSNQLYSAEEVANCHCQEGRFDPVCDESGAVTYITACYGLCQDYEILNDDTTVSKLEKTWVENAWASNTTKKPVGPNILYHKCGDNHNQTFSKAFCKEPEELNEECFGSEWGLIYISTLAALIVLPIAGVNTMVNVGSAPPEEKVLTLTVLRLSGKIFSSLWSAKVVGWLLDQTCVLNQVDDCGDEHQCLFYDNYKMRIYLFGFSLALIGCGTIIHSGMLVIRPRKHSPAWVAWKEEEDRLI